MDESCIFRQSIADEWLEIAAKSALYGAARQALFAHRSSHPPFWLMYLHDVSMYIYIYIYIYSLNPILGIKTKFIFALFNSDASGLFY